MIYIIIVNYNNFLFTNSCVKSILNSSFKNFKIIIVDNNSTDDSLHIVNLFKDRTNIKIININDYTPGKSINLGVKHAVNERILVLSAHSQITTLNTEILNKWFKIDKHVAVFGNQTPIYRGKRITKRYVWSHFTDDIEKNLYSNVEDRHFLHNAFCFYNRDFLLENPFSEKLSGKEDRYWATDIVKKAQMKIIEGGEWSLNEKQKSIEKNHS